VVYLGIATRTFRRYSTYTGATLAGAFTNSFFGLIVCFVYLAVWKENASAGGYDAKDAVTYVWLGQAMVMTMAIFGGGSPDDLAERVRSGDVAVDFYRPVGILGWHLAADLGRAAYHLIARGALPTLVGQLVFGLRWPPSWQAWLGFATALLLGIVVSFALRFLVALSAFWLLDSTGVRTLSITAATFFSGLVVPLVLFPGWMGEVAQSLPWASLLQVPADIWLGQRTGTELINGLAFELAWLTALLAIGSLVLRSAERRVVVQGG
jgi:ABC-2 type transport system permease protein